MGFLSNTKDKCLLARLYISKEIDMLERSFKSLSPLWLRLQVLKTSSPVLSLRALCSHTSVMTFIITRVDIVEMLLLLLLH
jgi:hypothetical protein